MMRMIERLKIEMSAAPAQQLRCYDVWPGNPKGTPEDLTNV
jgi:hypothetical protein